MSASIYPPAGLSIFDPGSVHEVWIDGMAYYFEEKGIVRSGYYVLEPTLPIVGEPASTPDRLARLALRLNCTVDCQRTMRQRVFASTEKAMPMLTAVATLLS